MVYVGLIFCTGVRTKGFRPNSEKYLKRLLNTFYVALNIMKLMYAPFRYTKACFVHRIARNCGFIVELSFETSRNLSCVSCLFLSQ